MTSRLLIVLLLSFFAVDSLDTPVLGAKAANGSKANGTTAVLTNERAAVTRVSDFMRTGGVSDPREYQVGSDYNKPIRSITQSLGYQAATGVVTVNASGTAYDLGSNQSQPRQIAIGCSGNIHVVWMQRDLQSTDTRWIYSASFVPGGAVALGQASSDGGGYPALTVDNNGKAVGAWHIVASGGTFAGIDSVCGAASFSESALYPDSCISGVGSGTTEIANPYVWPQIAGDKDAGSGAWFLHVISHESAPTTDSSGHQSLVYWRSIDNSVEPQGAVATFIDSLTSIGATICAHPDQSDERVAIVYGRPRYYNSYTQGLNANENIVYRESTDGGVNWGAVQTVYNFAATQDERPGTSGPFFERGWEVSALYTTDGNLHVVFSTVWSDTGNTFSGGGGYILSRPRRLYHWDKENDFPSIITERAPGWAIPCLPGSGGGMGNINKPSLTECQGKLYVTFGMNLSIGGGDTLAYSEPPYSDCSDGAFQNWDIYTKVSSTDGLTWGPDTNLTRTRTDGCAAGGCKSEVNLGSVERTSDSLRILYLEDLDAGVSINSSGEATMNPIRVQSIGCFDMVLIRNLAAVPAAIGYPFNVPPGSVKDTIISIRNLGNVATTATVASTAPWLTFPNGVDLTVPIGSSNTYELVARINTSGFEPSGSYASATVNVTYSSTDKAGQTVLAIPVELHSFSTFYLPQNASIRTATNQLCFNQASESADSVAGHRFSYFADASNYLFDGYLILGNDALNLSYSIFDGPFEGVPSPSNPYGYTYAATPEMVCDSTSYTSYRKATGRGVNRDTTIEFKVDWYAPKHTDSSDFYVGQFKIYKGSNNPTGTITNLSLAYYTDWDLPSDTNTQNTAGFDAIRSLIWTRGSWSSANLSRYAATAAYRNDGSPVIGGWVLDHPTYIYPNHGFENDSLWSIMESLVQGNYRIYTGDPIDVGGGMLIYRDATINGSTHDTLRFVVVLAATRNGGITGLNSAVDKSKKWICAHGLASGAAICPQIICGDANGSSGINISDAVFLLTYIFNGGPAPVEPATGDADGSGCVDLSDAVYLINYVFNGGPAPGPSCNINGCSNSTPANNQVRLACPVVVSSIAPGDSIPINVHLTSSTSIQGFSLGFSHNSPDLEFSSASRTSVLSSFGQWYVYNRQANNQILTGAVDLFGASLTPQNDAHVFTLYLKNVAGAQTQCINIDSAFVGPAGKFIYSVTNGGTIAAGYSDCGLQEVNIGEACEDSFRIAPKPWSFANSEANMWPHSWWQQFNYCAGLSPCQQYCLLCGPSDFPNWELFVSAIGEQQAYFDPPPGNVSFRPSAIAQWEALRGAWTGSCFGFAATSYLFYDNYLQVGTEFPGYNNLTSVPINGDSRKLINKYYLHQFGVEQQQLISNSLTTVTPAQTLTECKSMFLETPRDDRVLMMFNQTGSGGHAVSAYRCLQDGSDPDLWYLYIFDSNFPADTSKRIDIDLSGNTWSYSGQPGWGGGFGLFLLDPVSNYSAPLILADTAEATAGIRFYFGETDSAELESPAGTVGFTGDGIYGSVPGVSPIIPADGASTNPYGYILPTGEWYCRASGVIDGVFTIVDGEKRIFRNGGAKSGIISCYFKADATAPSLTSYGSSSDKGIYDSSFIEIISMAPDSEVSVQISGMELATSESLTVTLTADESIQIDNFGSAITYDLQVQIVSPTADTVFYTPDVQIDGSTSQLIAPDWRPTGDSIVIAVDTSMSGDFDSTVVVVNHNPPQFVCGDANGSGAINISDAVFLINYIFSGGQAPSPVLRGDANCSGGVNISDAVYLINYIFSGGAMPCAACQ